MKARTVGVHAGTPVVVALEVVALVAFIGLPPARFGWWPAAVISAVALLLLAPTVHRRNVPGWLAAAWRWRRSRRGKYRRRLRQWMCPTATSCAVCASRSAKPSR